MMRVLVTAASKHGATGEIAQAIGDSAPAAGAALTSHLPTSWRARLGAAIDWSWTFILADTGDDGTRLLLRVRGSTRPWWLAATYLGVLVPADDVMASSMLAGIRRRAAPAGQHLGLERMPHERRRRQPA